MAAKNVFRGDFIIPPNRIILALDGLSTTQAKEISNILRNEVAGGKINDMIDQHGAEAIKGMGFGLIMADPKLHDIPATVYKRMLAYTGKASFVTVHASNQVESLEKAAQAANEAGLKAIAVTILTSMTSEECQKIYGHDAKRMVYYLLHRAKDAGLHGIVCSPREVAMVRQEWPGAIIITPGVRSLGADNHDQMRVDTPENAIANGADFVVIGREIIQSDKPGLKADIIQHRINQVLSLI